MSTAAMPPPPRASSGARFVETVRDRWKVIAATAVACMLGALFVSVRSTKQYQATAKLVFQNDAFGAVLFGADPFQGSSDPARAAQTDVNLTVTPDVAAGVRSALGLKESVGEIMSRVSASPESNADIVDLTVTDTHPVQAARIANTFASQFIAQRRALDRAKVATAISQLQAQLSGLPVSDRSDRAQVSVELDKLRALQAVQLGNVSVASSAIPSDAPVSPTPKRDAAVGLVLGVILGVGLAMILDALDQRIKTSDEMREAYGLVPIGEIPQSAFNVRSRVAHRRALEAFRMVRNGLEAAAFAERSRLFVVTSASPREGKTTVAVNLARVLAMAGHHVILVEADLRRPTIQKVMDLDPAPGLIDALVHEAPVGDLLVADPLATAVVDDDALAPVSLYGGHEVGRQPKVVGDGPSALPAVVSPVRVLLSGHKMANTSELLSSDRMEEVLAELKETAHYVIVDAPPMAVPETVSLVGQPSVDGVIIVGRLSHTTRKVVRHAHELLVLSVPDHVRRAHLVITGVNEQDAYY